MALISHCCNTSLPANFYQKETGETWRQRKPENLNDGVPTVLQLSEKFGTAL
jgi:hypothetical protein